MIINQKYIMRIMGMILIRFSMHLMDSIVSKPFLIPYQIQSLNEIHVLTNIKEITRFVALKDKLVNVKYGKEFDPHIYQSPDGYDYIDWDGYYRFLHKRQKAYYLRAYKLASYNEKRQQFKNYELEVKEFIKAIKAQIEKALNEKITITEGDISI